MKPNVAAAEKTARPSRVMREEIRSRVSPELHHAFVRDAIGHKQSQSDRLREILEDYYELGMNSQQNLAMRLDRIERRQQIVAAMLDQLYLGLVLRLPKVPEEETDARIELAEDAHGKWVRAVTAIMEGTGSEWLRELTDRACQTGRL